MDDQTHEKLFSDLQQRMARVEATMDNFSSLLLPLVRDVHEIRESVKHRGGFVSGFIAALGILVGVVVAFEMVRVGL